LSWFCFAWLKIWLTFWLTNKVIYWFFTPGHNFEPLNEAEAHAIKNYSGSTLMTPCENKKEEVTNRMTKLQKKYNFLRHFKNSEKLFFVLIFRYQRKTGNLQHTVYRGM
jgi:hypothetical protein